MFESFRAVSELYELSLTTIPTTNPMIAPTSRVSKQFALHLPQTSY